MSAGTSWQGDERAGRFAGAPIWLLFLTLVSILNSGYRYFCDNHALQIPRVQTILDPDRFPGDPFSETLPGFVSWVWWLVAQLSRGVDIEIVLLVFFLIGRLLLVYSCWRLGTTLFPQSRMAPVAGAFLASLVPQSILADGNLTEVYFEQTSFFMGFFMLALIELLLGRSFRFYLLWGIAFVVNPMYGSWAAFFFLVTFAFDSRRPTIGHLIKRSPAFLILALPILVSSLRVFMQPSPSRELSTWVNRLLNAPHLAPETWDSMVFWDFSWFAALMVAWALAGRGRGPRFSNLLLAWTGFAVLSLVIGIWASVSDWGVRLLPIQPARATDLFYLTAGVAVAAAAGALVETRASIATATVATVSWGTIALLLSPSFRQHTTWIFVLAAVAVAGLVALLGFRSTSEQGRLRGFSRGVPLLAVCALLVLVTSWTAYGSVEERFQAMGNAWAALYRGPNPQVSEIADWAKAATEPESVFLHDPIAWEWAQFRYLANRPVFVTWKDGSAVLWEPAYAAEWSDRFAAMGFRGRWRDRWDVTRKGEIRRIRRSLRYRHTQLGDGDLQRLGSRYRIDYWVAPRSMKTSWPVVFRTVDYQVIEVPRP